MAAGSTQHLLKRQGLAPHKKLGQNFLVHERTPKRIVDLAGLHPDDRVIEVGVGLGALTRPLAAACAHVVGLEADAGIVRLHREQQDLPANVELIHADVLKVDLAALVAPGQKLKIVANLPYSISSPFLFRLIEHAELMDFAVVMLQKEMALRLMARPGTKEYGTPTVLLAACAEVRPLLTVDPAEFHPRPKVDSLVIRIAFQPRPARVQALGDFDRALLARIVHAAFGQRRKTLLNGLAGAGLRPDKALLADCIEACGLAPSVRAETLNLEDFVRLSRALAPGIPPNPCLSSPSP
ncbi:16S rRNA (adenine(1518)-N(6)/adenine(1519)-N(6))-dimethyltransferase RsmA [Desulfobulbus sp.]|uniref:16S rRNA (adenine(1518)-N(6)/adenine(1519)-N(6))- dimethyltransferase RsmA n=1 Tax=Desulfobulbus sp. TaxID=895 RepID=UPI00286F0363|nr:16S rRNA (adenine(1518)-N(6)/adenine(1519)-N(6))-dimethyltransferase RsmA [Desulfobulbus sp.]